MTNKLVIYHHNDMDGHAAAEIVAHALNIPDSEIDFREVDYARSIVQLHEDDDLSQSIVFIVDLSINADTIPQFKEVVKSAKKCIWIDHHKTSIDFSKEDPELASIQGIRDSRFCGAYLSYCYFKLDDAEVNQFNSFNPEEYLIIPDWIKYIDDWDTWKHKLGEGTQWFKYGFDLVDHTPGADSLFWDKLWFDDHYWEGILRNGMIIFQYISQDYAHTLKSIGYEATFEGERVFVLNRRGNSLMFGDKIKEYKFVVAYEFNGEVYKYSLYSDKDIDLTVIAKKYGGGGHPQACGFSSEIKLV